MQIIECDKRSKRLATSIAWAQANPQRVKEINAAYRVRNLEKRRAAYKRWAENNPEKRAAIDAASRDRRREELSRRSCKWAKDNPEKARVSRHAKRARERAATGTHTADEVASIRQQQRDKCAYCRTALKGRGQLDHIVALARGGSNAASNLQWLCSGCNARKGTKDAMDFARSLGRLI